MADSGHPTRAPRPGRQCRVMLALLCVAAWSCFVLFYTWRPRTLLLRARVSAMIVQRLTQQLASTASSRGVLPGPMDTSALHAAAARGGLPAINSSSAEWAAARVERRRRDETRSSDAQACYTLHGRSYRGRQHTTKSGLRCQPWSEQHPNKHAHDPAKHPDEGLESNFCRNPSGEAAPWCYNGEGTEPRFETCSIPLCAERYQEIAVPAHMLSPHSDLQAFPKTIAEHQLQEFAPASAAPSEITGEDRHGGEGRLLRCPSSYKVDAAAARAKTMYDSLPSHSKIQAGTSPLHFLSFYGGTSLEEWDHIVRAHCDQLELSPGQTVFEAGSAAGAFVDSLARQYGVRVAGVDLAPNLVAIARRRVFRGAGTPEFCAAAASNLSFIPDESFDHAVSFAVMMYISDAAVACRIASELVRIIKPGGKVFIGQANDPEMGSLRPPNSPSQGYWDVPRWFWYKFAYERGLRLKVLRGEEVYSKRLFPLLRHYDLHAHLRYNVYLEKPLDVYLDKPRDSTHLAPQPAALHPASAQASGASVWAGAGHAGSGADGGIHQMVVGGIARQARSLTGSERKILSWESIGGKGAWALEPHAPLSVEISNLIDRMAGLGAEGAGRGTQEEGKSATEEESERVWADARLLDQGGRGGSASEAPRLDEVQAQKARLGSDEARDEAQGGTSLQYAGPTSGRGKATDSRGVGWRRRQRARATSCDAIRSSSVIARCFPLPFGFCKKPIPSVFHLFACKCLQV